MEKKKSFFYTMIFKSRRINVLLVYFSCLLIGSCNSDSKNNKETENKGDSTVLKAVEADAAKLILNSFVFTDVQQKQLFNRANDIKQIIFKLVDEGEGKWGLIAAAQNDRGEIIGDPINLSQRPSPTYSFPSGSKKRDQILTRGDLKYLYDLSGELGRNTRIAEGNFKTLTLTPDLHQDVTLNDVLIFYATKSGTRTKESGGISLLVTGIATRPSPPAPPACTDECDN